MAKFIWVGTGNAHKFHLTKLDMITMPKSHGGWGIFNIKLFVWALLIKTLWQGLFGKCLWGDVIQSKYLLGIKATHWMREGLIGKPTGSTNWISLNKVKYWLLKRTCWIFGLGRDIIIGRDHNLGIVIETFFSDKVTRSLNIRRYFYLDQAVSSWTCSILVWKRA